MSFQAARSHGDPYYQANAGCFKNATYYGPYGPSPYTIQGMLVPYVYADPPLVDAYGRPIDPNVQAGFAPPAANDPYAGQAPDPYAGQALDPYAGQAPYAVQAPDPYAVQALDPYPAVAPNPYPLPVRQPYARPVEQYYEDEYYDDYPPPRMPMPPRRRPMEYYPPPPPAPRPAPAAPLRLHVTVEKSYPKESSTAPQAPPSNNQPSVAISRSFSGDTIPIELLNSKTPVYICKRIV